MTKEQLMNIRYKLIADYPGNSQLIGLIFESSIMEYYDKYPHLFQKLQWWEERGLSDMPEYVSWISLSRNKRIYEKAVKWEITVPSYSSMSTPRMMYFINVNEYSHDLCDSHLPATLEEYNQYKQTTTVN